MTIADFIQFYYSSDTVKYLEDMKTIDVIDSQTGEVYINNMLLKDAILLTGLLKDCCVDSFNIGTTNTRVYVNNYEL